MSGHADTIRHTLNLVIAYDRANQLWEPAESSLLALAALVAENQQQAQATKQLATDLADLQLRLIERNAENQQQAEEIDRLRSAVLAFQKAADAAVRAALDGTPSEDTE